MSDERRPWYPLYADAHLSDPDLLQCSYAAEGLLWRMMSWSHNGEPYGYVTNGGKPMTVEAMARARFGIRASRKDIAGVNALLKELIRHNRIGHDLTGAYFIPKMVRIGEQKELAREYGRRGGNPAITDGGEAESPNVDYDGAMERWNRAAKKNGVRTFSKWTALRRAKYRRRTEEQAGFWEAVERELPMLGEFAKESNWFGFDFIIHSEQNFVKFEEGKYRDQAKPGAGRAQPTAEQTFTRVLNEILMEYAKRDDVAKEDYLASCWDKYKDTPRLNGRHVMDAVKANLKHKRAQSAGEEEEGAVSA